MSLQTGYALARERWTWKYQLMDDDRTKILSPLKIQSHDGCSYYALAATLEPNLRVQWKRNVTLSIDHLMELNEDSRTKLPNVSGKIKRLLKMVQNEGVCEEKQYERIMQHRLRTRDARLYKIIKFTAYDVKTPEEIRQALRQLRRGGPLLAVIRISSNYDSCSKSGLIYRYDPSKAVVQDGIPKTHAVAVVSFGLEAKAPFLECQDSHGATFGRKGFLMVDITSLKELYSIRVHLSSR